MGPGGSSPSLQQQQQGPPPPYCTTNQGSATKKLQKAGMPEKYDKKPGHSNTNSPMPDGQLDMFKNNSAITTSGLQTTPSPQLMNYIEFEGQELVITKQLNQSYKGPGGGPFDEDEIKFNPQQPGPPGPPGQNNSAIINYLNPQNPNNQSPGTNQLEINEDKKIKSENTNDQHDFNQNFNPALNSSNPNHRQSPGLMNNGAPGGPLNSMLQMTNSIPKASPYASSTAKSPGLNHHPQFNHPNGPQMSVSPAPNMPHGMPHPQMNGPPMMQQPQPPSAPAAKTKLTKKEKLLQQQLHQKQAHQQLHPHYQLQLLLHQLQ